MGRPSGWLRQNACVKRSITRSSGVSSTMLISSKMTFFSLVISRGSNSGLSTMSPRMSTASGRCSSSTFRWKEAYSLAVKASMWPPMESTWAAMTSAGRVFVPLKTMCSMKWLIPPCSEGSCRLPRLSQTPMATLRTWGMDSVTRVRPFSKTSLTMAMGRTVRLAWRNRRAKQRAATGPPTTNQKMRNHQARYATNAARRNCSVHPHQKSRGAPRRERPAAIPRSRDQVRSTPTRQPCR